MTRVGQDVDAFCGRCKLSLAHTVLAMVGSTIARVRCNTCTNEHSFRGAASSTPRRSETRAAPAKVTVSFQETLAQRDLSAARLYSPKTTFAADEVILHASFGYGIVSAVREDKVDVTFKAFEKTLVHGRAEGQAGRTEPLRPPRPPPDDSAATQEDREKE